MSRKKLLRRKRHTEPFSLKKDNRSTPINRSEKESGHQDGKKREGDNGHCHSSSCAVQGSAHDDITQIQTEKSDPNEEKNAEDNEKGVEGESEHVGKN